jgi:hypothetical protein
LPTRFLMPSACGPRECHSRPMRSSRRRWGEGEGFDIDVCSQKKAMSKIPITIDHDSLLWPAVDSDSEIRSYNHSWDGNTVSFGDGGIRITCEVELSEVEQSALVKCLTKDSASFVPHWQTLTIDVHRTVQRIEKQVWDTARFVDCCFRRSPKVYGLRL